jgi:hypothetical protein
MQTSIIAEPAFFLPSVLPVDPELSARENARVRELVAQEAEITERLETSGQLDLLAEELREQITEEVEEEQDYRAETLKEYEKKIEELKAENARLEALAAKTGGRLAAARIRADAAERNLEGMLRRTLRLEAEARLRELYKLPALPKDLPRWEKTDANAKLRSELERACLYMRSAGVAVGGKGLEYEMHSKPYRFRRY